MDAPCALDGFEKRSAIIAGEAAYLEKEHPRLAAQFVKQISAAAQQLAKFPSMGRPGRAMGTRKLVAPGTKYIIPYCARDQAVEMLRLFHSSRKWLQRLQV